MFRTPIDKFCLEEALKNNDSKAIEMMDEIGQSKDFECSDILLRYYEKVIDHGIRNHIALALADLSCEKMIEPTIKLIKRPELSNNNGTLIYALSLQSFDYTKYFDLFSDLLFSESPEVAWAASDILSGMLDKISKNKKQKVANRIEDKIHSLMADVIFLSKALEAFRDTPIFALHRSKSNDNKPR